MRYVQLSNSDKRLFKLQLEPLDLSLRDEQRGWTPLRFAVGHGHTAVAKLLIDCGASVKEACSLEASLGSAAAFRVVDIVPHEEDSPHLTVRPLLGQV